MDLKELFERIIGGDEEAFEKLYNMFSPKVYRIAFMYAGNREEADEITSDVFVKIWRSASRFKWDSSLSTWIYRITVNTAIDYKKKKRLNLEELKEASFTHKNEERDFLKDALVQDALMKLPPKQRIAIILTQIEGYSYKETSQIMSKSVKAIESLVQRGKSNLRKLLLPILKRDYE